MSIARAPAQRPRGGVGTQTVYYSDSLPVAKSSRILSSATCNLPTRFIRVASLLSVGVVFVIRSSAAAARSAVSCPRAVACRTNALAARSKSARGKIRLAPFSPFPLAICSCSACPVQGEGSGSGWYVNSKDAHQSSHLNWEPVEGLPKVTGTQGTLSASATMAACIASAMTSFAPAISRKVCSTGLLGSRY